MGSILYKVVGRAEWAAAEAAGTYAGSADDRRDGYIHLSTRAQLPGTLAKHFAGHDDLLLLAIDAHALAPRLKWEPARGGALFPHLYGDLPIAVVRATTALVRDDEGRHRLPAEPD